MIRRLVAAVLPLLCIEHAIAQGSQTVCFSDSSPDEVIPACDDLIEIDPRHAQAYQARGVAVINERLLTTLVRWPSIQNISETTIIEVSLGKQKENCTMPSMTFGPSRILIPHF
jgi:hypothetical protein